MKRVQPLTAEDMFTVDDPPPCGGDSEVDFVCLESTGARVKNDPAKLSGLGDASICMVRLSVPLQLCLSSLFIPALSLCRRKVVFRRQQGLGSGKALPHHPIAFFPVIFRG